VKTSRIYQAKSFDVSTFIVDNIHVDISDMVKIYPNPVSDNLIIDCRYDIESVYVLDISGRMVFNSKPMQQRLIIPVNQLNDGLYIIKGTTKNGQFISKFIKH